MKPVIYWVRRDFRLSDNAALRAACDTGQPVIPVFICDDVVEGQGAAPKYRLGEGVRQFSKSLEAAGSRLILRRGTAVNVLQNLLQETGANSVFWNRLYDPISKKRDINVKSTLIAEGVDARSFAGHLLFEPWTVQNKSGGYYKVFTPMWKMVRTRDVARPSSKINNLQPPIAWPHSDDLRDWGLGRGLYRGLPILANHVCVGEDAAKARLDRFIKSKVDKYATGRDFPGQTATSCLSENLTYGEISPATCWQAGWEALHNGKQGAEIFCKELVWREFAYHLTHHTPHITTDNWKKKWDEFPWNEDETTKEVRAWKQGRTGVPFVDAAMREMYVTGVMHNRARMIVASYLTKHLSCHWKIGLKWFEDCLTDWDPASNAMGWQWAAGCGPDAAPFFRIFNPDTQLGKFDSTSEYRNRWIAEGQADPTETALSYFDAVPKSWGLSPQDVYPDPVVDLGDGRRRALAAYKTRLP